MEADLQALFHRLDDEPLVCLAIDGKCRPAADVLLMRHRPWITAWIAKRGKAYRLGTHDIEDATQTAMVVVAESVIPWYHRCWRSTSPPQPFRHFLTWVVGNRFKDFVRNLRCEQERIEYSLELTDTKGPWEDANMVARNWRDKHDDPLTEILHHEFLIALGNFLERLNPVERQLWDLMMAQHSLGEMAVALCIPYSTVRRLRTRLTEKLRRFLEPYFPAEGGRA
jgi:RNA polymerase sigma factor (sigma-70 family)